MYVHAHLGQDEVEWVKLVTFLKRRKHVQDRARQGESKWERNFDRSNRVTKIM